MDRQEDCGKCNSRFQTWINAVRHFLKKKQKLLSRTEAYNTATYGQCTDKEEYITNKQVNINSLIKERINSISINETEFEKYFLVLSFNDTEEECSEEILKPFKENGYKIIRISNYLDILKGTNVYLLSWKQER